MQDSQFELGVVNVDQTCDFQIFSDALQTELSPLTFKVKIHRSTSLRFQKEIIYKFR